MKIRSLMALALLAAFAAGCSTEPGRGRDVKPEVEKEKPKAKDADKDKKDKKKDPGPPEKLGAPKQDDSEVSATDKPGVIEGRVQAEGAGLRDVMVWVDKVSPDVCPPAGDPPVLTRVRGGYQPRAQFVAVGASLRLRTTDDSAEFHGSNLLKFTRTVKRGETKEVKLSREGLELVRGDEFTSEETAYVRVLAHGCNAVTGGDGTFVLPKLPPGQYVVHLWPVGRKSKNDKNLRERVTFTLAEGKGARIDWQVPQ